jgi:hypothetical protein
MKEIKYKCFSLAVKRINADKDNKSPEIIRDEVVSIVKDWNLTRLTQWG